MSRNYDGTGLGLPLSKSLMEEHGGTLVIESEPGKGTTVTVAFPPERLLDQAIIFPAGTFAAMERED